MVIRKGKEKKKNHRLHRKENATLALHTHMKVKELQPLIKQRKAKIKKWEECVSK